MKGIIFFKPLMGIFLLGSITFCAKASEGKPSSNITIKLMTALDAKTDTIPTPIKSAEAGSAKPVTEKPVAGIIKVVPKARRVTVPRQVIKVVPVKLVKPKIIKPVIKLLN